MPQGVASFLLFTVAAVGGGLFLLLVADAQDARNEIHGDVPAIPDGLKAEREDAA